MAASSTSPPLNHPFHPFRTTQAYNKSPNRTTYISTSTPPSPRTRHFTSISPEIPAPPKILRKTSSTSAIHQPMPPLAKNRQRAPTLPASDRRNPYNERRTDESYLPFEPPSSHWMDRRTRKRSAGGFFSPPVSPISTAHISAPSSTIRLSSDPIKASAQLGFNHGYPITPPDLPSIHGVFDKFDAGPPSPAKPRKLSTRKPPPIDTSTRSSRRDTLKLPMMDPTDRSTGITQPSPNSSSSATPDDIDLSEWDLVSLQSARPISRISRSKPDPSPVPTYTNFSEWVDPETQLSSAPGKYTSNELDLRAIEVLEHFSGHLLKDGWGDELERYRPNPKPAPAVPAKSKLRNDQSRTLPHTAPGDTMGYSEWGHQRRQDLDAGSMRSWREARKKSKPPTLRPLSEQPPLGSNHIQGGTPTLRPTSPTTPLKSTTLAPGLSVTRPSLDRRDSQDENETTPKGNGMRRVSSALSRMSSDEKRRPKIKVPLMLDSKVKGETMDQVGSPTSPVPIQHRPLPPLPGITRNAAGPSRSNSAGPAGLLQLKFQRGLLRPKRPATASIAEDGIQGGQLRKLSARDEPHLGSPLSPRPDAADKRDRRKGMTALSFLAMEDPYTTERSIDQGRPSLDGSGPIVVEHILPPEELSKIISESSARRGSWSSDSADGGNPDASSLDCLIEEGLTTDGHTELQSPITSPSVRKSVSMERSKLKKKMEYRKSSGQASLALSFCLDNSPFSPLSPTSFDDELPARPTALPPPPRPRYSLTGRKDGPRVGAGFMSTPPLPDTSPNSARLSERPQTFMALSTGTSPVSRYSLLPTRPTSPISPPISPTSPVRQLYSPHGDSLSPTPEPPEGLSPVTSVFGQRGYSGEFGPAPTPTPGSGPGTSLVQSTQSRPRESISPGMAALGGDDRASVSTTNTSRRDAEREERERAMREWLRMKPRRGMKDGATSGERDAREISPAP